MTLPRPSLKIIAVNLLTYGITHAAIDCICAATIFSIFKDKLVDAYLFFGLVVVYDSLAFAIQPVLGLLADKYRSAKLLTVIGCAVTGIAALSYLTSPIVAAILAGIGNALFHVGGGIISLNLTPKKATAPGIFVAPGAIGLLIGTLLGKNGQFIPLFAFIVLILLCVLILFTKPPEINYSENNKGEIPFNKFELILLFIFLAVAVRSLVGSVLIFPWKTDINLLYILTGAVFLGKAAGGILADKLGWTKVAVCSLIISIPFIILDANIPILAIMGMFFFNMTMPITLTAISNILPGRAGFAFGLTTLALIIGAIPSFLSNKGFFANEFFLFFVIIAAVIMLYKSLRWAENV